jgi:hypothetical protein
MVENFPNQCDGSTFQAQSQARPQEILALCFRATGEVETDTRYSAYYSYDRANEVKDEPPSILLPKILRFWERISENKDSIRLANTRQAHSFIEVISFDPQTQIVSISAQVNPEHIKFHLHSLFPDRFVFDKIQFVAKPSHFHRLNLEPEEAKSQIVGYGIGSRSQFYRGCVLGGSNDFDRVFYDRDLYKDWIKKCASNREERPSSCDLWIYDRNMKNERLFELREGNSRKSKDKSYAGMARSAVLAFEGAAINGLEIFKSADFVTPVVSFSDGGNLSVMYEENGSNEEPFQGVICSDVALMGVVEIMSRFVAEIVEGLEL